MSVFDASQITILCVDDEPNILSSLKRLFRSVGYGIETAASGAEGLKLLETHSVDMVISDMRMPEMDGAEFLERVVEKWPLITRILLTGHADIASTIEAINKGKIYRYVSKPWEENDLKLTVRSGLEQRFLEQERRRLEKITYKQNEQLLELNSQLEIRVEQRTQDIVKANEALNANYALMVKVFANLIEAREPALAGHSRRVAELSKKVALQTGMNEVKAQDVLYAALFHDIGKIGFPDELFSKPYESLSSQELERVQSHPMIGQGILVALDPLQEAGWIIRNHHERYDGHGYPSGLSGEDIPLGARILAIVSDYDALQLGNLVKEKMSPAQARRYISERAGSYYDPNVLPHFFKILDAEEVESGLQPIILTTDELEMGMVLVKDLVTEDGVLLLSKGFALDDKMIKKIKTFERLVGCQLNVHIRYKE
ncbi:MAG: HD domain-containing phosphohydrolase [Pseudomonadota bacterium]